ncbi:hypothetical protein ACPPVO_24820 [Dactylosporangium sp. McL0621]|uniref:hypothetical protein n=1 Tax=Dactylosporangium sp. McL0621 TaxID=3415678 RepID=UPI003CF98AEA
MVAASTATAATAAAKGRRRRDRTGGADPNIDSTAGGTTGAVRGGAVGDAEKNGTTGVPGVALHVDGALQERAGERLDLGPAQRAGYILSQAAR